MILEADDSGRLICSAAQLRAVTWPYEAKLTVPKVEESIQDLAIRGLIVLYELDGLRYAAFPSWKDHQRINRPFPSRIPGPPSSLIIHGASGEPITERSVNDHVSITGDLEVEGKWKGKEVDLEVEGRGSGRGEHPVDCVDNSSTSPHQPTRIGSLLPRLTPAQDQARLDAIKAKP